MKFYANILVFLGAVDAATKIAVVELGVGGAVRRTSSQARETSVQAVSSFFESMHGSRRIQHAGMPLVPDLFRKADAGVIIGLMGDGVHLPSMPSLAALFEGVSNRVVGQLETSGSHCGVLVSRAKSSEEITTGLSSAVASASTEKTLVGVKMTVDDSKHAESVDKDISAMIEELDQKTKNEGKTVVLYVVIEDISTPENRRLEERQLGGGGGNNNNQNNNQNNNYNNNQNNNQNKNQNNNNYNNNQNNNQQQAQKVGQYYLFQKEGSSNGQSNVFAQMFAGYYGYGYYNAYGEWVTPYKSMFQIQYFNVVLWTALGLTLVLSFTIMMMLFMPLEPDTLLFGESAKMVGEE